MTPQDLTPQGSGKGSNPDPPPVRVTPPKIVYNAIFTLPQTRPVPSAPKE